MENRNKKFVSYSLNLFSYLKASGIEIYFDKDEEDRVYMYCIDTEEVRELVREYKNDEHLHKVLNGFIELKKAISEFKYGK